MTNMSIQRGIEKQTRLAVKTLKDGGVVAFPTDTVYGLGADPLNIRAVERVYRMKERPQKLPLPLLLADKSELTKVAASVPEIAWRLIEKFLPVGLSIVLKKSDWVPGPVAGGGNTIAVRIPNHKITIDLINGLGSPIIGTSANISGKQSPVTAREVREQLGSKVDFIIDGGRCPGGLESTVIDVSGNVPILIREGAVPVEEIEKACGLTLRKA